MALTPTMAQTENRVRDLITSGVAGGQKDAVIKYLQSKLADLTMRGAVGTDEYLIIAGELQTLKKAPPPEPNRQSVISELLPAPLTPPPPMMPQGVAQGVPQGVAPEDAGGLAAMEAPNMEGVATMAGGGLVAFADGGEVPRFQNTGLVQYDPNTPFNRMFPDPNRRRQLTQEELDEARRLKEMGLLEGIGEFVVDPVKRFFATSGRQDLQRGMTQGYGAQPTPGSLPADVRRADASEMVNVPMPAGVAPTATAAPTPSTAAASATSRADQTTPANDGGLGAIAKAQGMDYATAEKQAQAMMGQQLAGIGDPLADIKEELKNASDKRKKDLEQTAWLRASQAFFGIATGDKTAIVQGIKDYGNDIKESDKISREDRKLLADIKRLETADKRDNVFKTADLSLKILNEANAQQRAELAARTQLQVANIGKTTAEAGRAEARDDRLLLQAQELASKQVRDDMRLNMAPAAQKDAEIRRLTAAYYNQLMELRGGKGAQAPTGTTLRFDAKGNPIQ